MTGLRSPWWTRPPDLPWPQRREERQRVDSRAGDPHGPMEVRTRDAPGGANLADHVACCHLVTLAHADGREVREERQHAEPVIDHDGPAGTIQRGCQDHAS